MFQLSNVEFMLLALISEQEKVSGYQLDTLAAQRGYREWADIGTTSIYLGLKKLKEKGHVSAATDRYKKGRGPKGTLYTLTPEGADALKSETQQGLSAARERDQRFVLALSALHILSPSEIAAAFTQRREFLRQEYERVQRIYQQQQPHVSPGGMLIFEHALAGMQHEISLLETWTARLSHEGSAIISHETDSQ